MRQDNGIRAYWIGTTHNNEKRNGTGLALKICEKEKMWVIVRKNSLDNSIKTIKIKPDSVSLNNEVKCWKPVFMWISGI